MLILWMGGEVAFKRTERFSMDRTGLYKLIESAKNEFFSRFIDYL